MFDLAEEWSRWTGGQNDMVSSGRLCSIPQVQLEKRYALYLRKLVVMERDNLLEAERPDMSLAKWS